ncbi:MAG: hypothetical protein ACREBD_12465 [Blastocatellia bacterium]
MKKTVVIFAGILLLHSFLWPTTSLADSAENSKRASNIRSQILKLGSGVKTRLEVTLQDGTKLKGYIREADVDYFVLVNVTNDRAVVVTYPQVRQAKGHNLSEGMKILIGVGILIGIVIAVAIASGKE